MKNVFLLVLILLYEKGDAQVAFLPLVDGADTIGFFQGNEINPRENAFLFKSPRAEAFANSHPDFDFKWSSLEMMNKAYLEWNPFGKFKTEFFEILGPYEYTGDKYRHKGTYYKIKPSAIIDKKGKAEELYKLTLNYINETYNSPEDVIKGEIEGKYLRLNGSLGFFLNKANGFYEGKYTIEFRFKDDRFKVDVINFELRYALQGPYYDNNWYPFDSKFHIKNAHGKILERGWSNLYLTLNYFETLIRGLKDYDDSGNDW